MDIAAPFSLRPYAGRSGPFTRAADPDFGSLAILSTMPPQRCGLATFAADLKSAVAGAAGPELRCLPIAIDGSGPGGTPPTGLVLPRDDRSAYAAVAATLDRSGIDLLCVQHEFGIFGGPDGEMLLDLLDAFTGPVVATLHTVLDNPSPNQRRVVAALVRRSARLVVMTKHSARLMREVYATPPECLRVVPHGIPLPPGLGAPRQCSDGRRHLLTFGLLSPGKGIEHAVRALPAIVARHRDVLYTVLGATHPNLVRAEGERYRESLLALAEELGVARNIRFVNRFASLEELTDAIIGSEIYLTPYNNEAQSVSGTLAYSYGLGSAVVSTPYRHAVELLGEGRGTLVPFANPDAIGDAVNALLDDPARLLAMRRAAWEAGRTMGWDQVGRDYLAIFREALAGSALPAAPEEAALG